MCGVSLVAPPGLQVAASLSLARAIPSCGVVALSMRDAWRGRRQRACTCVVCGIGTALRLPAQRSMPPPPLAALVNRSSGAGAAMCMRGACMCNRRVSRVDACTGTEPSVPHARMPRTHAAHQLCNEGRLQAVGGPMLPGADPGLGRTPRRCMYHGLFPYSAPPCSLERA